MIVASLAAAVFAAMIGEAIVSARHDRALRARGAVEPAGDVFAAMQIAYPASFLAIFAEGAARGAASGGLLAGGLAVLVLAKALKYWAIGSLGGRWTFRVLVPPGAVSTVSGPYRWVSHPNYLAVAGEIAGIALAMHAFITGPIGLAGFGWLMRRRIKVEERALAGKMQNA